ncbi:unnamed protein product, partial [Didymodactylos carnosus]
WDLNYDNPVNEDLIKQIHVLRGKIQAKLKLTDRENYAMCAAAQCDARAHLIVIKKVDYKEIITKINEKIEGSEGKMLEYREDNGKYSTFESVEQIEGKDLVEMRVAEDNKLEISPEGEDGLVNLVEHRSSDVERKPGYAHHDFCLNPKEKAREIASSTKQKKHITFPCDIPKYPPPMVQLLQTVGGYDLVKPQFLKNLSQRIRNCRYERSAQGKANQKHKLSRKKAKRKVAKEEKATTEQTESTITTNCLENPVIQDDRVILSLNASVSHPLLSESELQSFYSMNFGVNDTQIETNADRSIIENMNENKENESSSKLTASYKPRVTNSSIILGARRHAENAKLFADMGSSSSNAQYIRNEHDYRSVSSTVEHELCVFLRNFRQHWYRYHVIDKVDELEENAPQRAIPTAGLMNDEMTFFGEAIGGHSHPTHNDSLQKLEKQIIYMLIALQVTHYVSDTCVNYVAESLSKIFDVAHITRVVRKQQHDNIVKEVTVRFTYIPFLMNLKNFLQLRKVQHDLNKQIVPPNPNLIQDYHDGEFSRQHPYYKHQKYLKIELNSDDINLSNPVSHRSYKMLLYYWSLLNLSREVRSKQTAKRLVACCPSWLSDYDGLYHTIDDFLSGIQTLEKEGIQVTVDGTDQRYFGGLFFTIGDYLAQTSMHGFKESVSAKHFCPLCNVTLDGLEPDIDLPLNCITIDEYRRRLLCYK